MATERKAEVEWIGGLIDGEGKIISTTSGLIPELDVTWDARNDETEPQDEPGGAARRSPRIVFLDAARARSRRRGLGPRGDHRLRERHVRGRHRDHRDQAHRAGRVGGHPRRAVREIAERAKATCPVSKALAGVEITLELPDLPPLEEEELEDEELASLDAADQS